MPENVKRYDLIALPGSIKRGDDGTISADPIITRTGVFSYRLKDGSVRHEFRSDDVVFSDAALKSIQMIPITDGHPEGFVTPANAKELAIGMTGENARRDGINVRVPIKITTEDGINAVEGGRLQLSLGYNCQVERKDGEFEGQKYTHVQSNIICNHLALCDRARAGAQATLRLDELDAEMVQADRKKNEPRKETKTMPETVKLRLDSNGISYDVPEEVEADYGTMRKDRDDAVEKTKDETKAKDELQGKFDAQTEELEKLKKVDNTDAIAKGVAERSKLLETVRPMVKEDVAKKLDEMTDAEIKIAGIASQVEKFDGKDADGKDHSDDYIKARLSGAVEAFEKTDEANSATGSTVVGNGERRKDAGTAAEARDRMKARHDGTAKPKDKEKK